MQLFLPFGFLQIDVKLLRPIRLQLRDKNTYFLYTCYDSMSHKNPKVYGFWWKGLWAVPYNW